MINKPILQENEEIRDVKGYEGFYAVTSYGRVWSYRSNMFIAPYIHRGYLRISLYSNKQTKHHYVHRLVAQAFLANPDGLPQVNHKDENKQNNFLSNLEWCDSKYNINYGTRTKRTMKPVYCVELDKVFESATFAAKEFNLHSGSHISECCKGKRNTCCGYHWEFVREGAAAC